MNGSGAILLVLHSGLILFPWVMSYGFRNCIQTFDNLRRYNCIQRFLHEVQDAVSDLPSDAQVLNISHNYIRQLRWGSFRNLTQLSVLRMDNNVLQEIHNGAFENLTALDTLNISSNQISSLSRGAFLGLTNLTRLLIHNNQLQQVDLDTFHLLQSLTILDLASNSLHNFSLVMDSISSLNSLTTLNLCKNSLDSLPPSTDLPNSLWSLSLCNNSLNSMESKPDYFIHVRWLDLSANNLKAPTLAHFNLQNVTHLIMKNNSAFQIIDFLTKSNISPQSIDYSGMNLHGRNLSELCHYLGNTTLPKLSLRRNGIEHLDNSMFLQCPVVKDLDLSENKLKRLLCLKFVHKNGLQSLEVQHNLLSRLESCSQSRGRLGSLQNLILSYNRILVIEADAFSFAPNLTILHLNLNIIAQLSKSAFQGLSNLEELRLDNNLLTDLYNSSFAELRNLRRLLLRNNRVSVIFPKTFVDLEKLEILDLGGNAISHLTKESFYGLKSLSRLYLDWNFLIASNIYSEIFSYVYKSLDVLDLKGNYMTYISRRKEKSPFVTLQKLRTLKIQAQQPYGIKIVPPKFFKGLTSLKYLDLSNNKILTLSGDAFDDLGELTQLYLSDSCNGIQNLPTGIFRNLTKLQVLDLENVGLQSLTKEVFGNLTELQALHLMKNALKVVNETVLVEMKKLRYLDLRKCPLSCTCKNKWFQSWLNNSNVQIVYPYNQSCDIGAWANIYNLDMNVCHVKLGQMCFCGTAPLVLLFMIIPILYMRYYWRIKHSVYVFRAWFRENLSRKQKDQYKYDAFISYNSHDEPWVLDVLLPNLESGDPSSFRLCLHHRDFELGRDIIDNIVDSIYNSRKTICVISKSYLRSEWCSLEIQMASYRLLDELKDVLVLIFLEKISERDLSAYHKMRKVMLKKTYISWPPEPEAQKLFWTKVRKALQGNAPEEESTDGLSMRHGLLVESATLLS